MFSRFKNTRGVPATAAPAPEEIYTLCGRLKGGIEEALARRDTESAGFVVSSEFFAALQLRASLVYRSVSQRKRNKVIRDRVQDRTGQDRGWRLPDSLPPRIRLKKLEKRVSSAVGYRRSQGSP